MPDMPSDRAITLADNALRALASLVETARREVVRLTVEHSRKSRKPTDKTPIQIAVDNAQHAIRKRVHHLGFSKRQVAATHNFDDRGR